MGAVVNRIAAISACWGILLASTSFVFIVFWSSPKAADQEQEDVISATLFSQAILLALGCIQTLFSVLVLTTSLPHIKERWTTTWICVHVLVVLGLVFFFAVHEYMSHTTAWVHRATFSTLDLVVLCDFAFLSFSFVILLWTWKPLVKDGEIIAANPRPNVPVISANIFSRRTDGIVNPLWASNAAYHDSRLNLS